MSDPEKPSSLPKAAKDYVGALGANPPDVSVLPLREQGRIADEKIGDIRKNTLAEALQSIERDGVLLGAKETYLWRIDRAAVQSHALHALEDALPPAVRAKRPPSAPEEQQKLSEYKISLYERNLAIIRWNERVIDRRVRVKAQMEKEGIAVPIDASIENNAALHLSALSPVLRSLTVFKNYRMVQLRKNEGAISDLQYVRDRTRCANALPSLVRPALERSGRAVAIDCEKFVTLEPQAALDDPTLTEAEALMDRDIDGLLSYAQGNPGIGVGREGLNPLDVFLDAELRAAHRAALEAELQAGLGDEGDRRIQRLKELQKFLQDEMKQYERELAEFFSEKIRISSIDLFRRDYEGASRQPPEDWTQYVRDVPEVREDLDRDWTMQRQALREHRRLIDETYDLSIFKLKNFPLLKEEVYKEARLHGVIQLLDGLVRLNATPSIIYNRISRSLTGTALPDTANDFLNPEKTFRDEAHTALQGLRKAWQLPENVTLPGPDGKSVEVTFDPWNQAHWEAIPPEQWELIKKRIATTKETLRQREGQVKGSLGVAEGTFDLMDALRARRHPLDLINTTPDQALYDLLCDRKITPEKIMQEQNLTDERLAAVWLYLMLEFHTQLDEHAETVGLAQEDLFKLANEKAEAHHGLQQMARDNKWTIMSILLAAWYVHGVVLSVKHSPKFMRLAVLYHLSVGAPLQMGTDLVYRIPRRLVRGYRAVRRSRIARAEELVADKAVSDIDDLRRLGDLVNLEGELAAEQARHQSILHTLAGEDLAEAEQFIREAQEHRFRLYQKEARLLDAQLTQVEALPHIGRDGAFHIQAARDRLRPSIDSFRDRFNVFCREVPTARAALAEDLLGMPSGKIAEGGSLLSRLEQAHSTQLLGTKRSILISEDATLGTERFTKDQADRLMRLGVAGEKPSAVGVAVRPSGATGARLVEGVAELGESDVGAVAELAAKAKNSPFVRAGTITFAALVDALFIVQNEGQIRAMEEKDDQVSANILREKRGSLVRGLEANALSIAGLKSALLFWPAAAAIAIDTAAANYLYDYAIDLNQLSSSESLKGLTGTELLTKYLQVSPEAREPADILVDGTKTRRNVRENLIFAYLLRNTLPASERLYVEEAKQWYDALTPDARKSWLEKLKSRAAVLQERVRQMAAEHSIGLAGRKEQYLRYASDGIFGNVAPQMLRRADHWAELTEFYESADGQDVTFDGRAGALRRISLSSLKMPPVTEQDWNRASTVLSEYEEYRMQQGRLRYVALSIDRGGNEVRDYVRSLLLDHMRHAIMNLDVRIAQEIPDGNIANAVRLECRRRFESMAAPFAEVLKDETKSTAFIEEYLRNAEREMLAWDLMNMYHEATPMRVTHAGDAYNGDKRIRLSPHRLQREFDEHQTPVPPITEDFNPLKAVLKSPEYARLMARPVTRTQAIAMMQKAQEEVCASMKIPSATMVLVSLVERN
ncbi:MAG: hypothetical protein PHZ00_02660 [Candidatus Peribacteraceae bacterium]|nr:hypothetical protein [Candidatus Peribacteraceae bacterium]